MKQYSRSICRILIIAVLGAIPVVLVYAEGLIPCSGNACRACDLGILANKIIRFLIMIGSLLATLSFMYAGFELVTSGGNGAAREHAKSMFKNVIIGVVLMLSGYLIVNTVMQTLVGDAYFQGKKWNEIQCIPNPDPTAPVTGPATIEVGTPTSLGGVPAEQVLTAGSAASIAEATALAAANGGVSSSDGPGGGSVACAWMVNNILTAAGVDTIDANLVSSMEKELQNGRGTLVSDSQARAGDIVIQAGQGHVGICQNDGCTRVISNASGTARFNWVSSTSFEPSYSAGPGRIYRVK